jgi:hypothetical protein
MKGEFVFGDGVKPGVKKLESVIGTVTVERERKEEEMVNKQELLIGINKSQVSCLALSE